MITSVKNEDKLDIYGDGIMFCCSSQQHILGFVIGLKNDYYYFLLCLQLLGHKNYYVVAKDIKMPSGIIVL
jgi:hypothetical protein